MINYNLTEPARYVNALSEMPRWEKYPTPMIHRSSLYTHRERTKAIALFLARIVGASSADVLSRIEFLASHHDDHEIIDTDVPSPEKENMTQKQKRLEATQQITSFQLVARLYLQLNSSQEQDYMQEMKMYQKKTTLATQLVDVADKLDALGEVFHELRCGNTGFLDSYLYYRDTKLPSFEKYSFWKSLKQYKLIGLLHMPSLDSLVLMPRLEINHLKSRQMLKKDVYSQSLPTWYKSWLEISYELFKKEPQPEFHIFPGWKNELRLKWNYQK